MTNLYGRGKEPFWQQASTNLVKFVILLHQVLDGYVTLVQVYQHVINPDKLKVKIGEGDERFAVQRRIHIGRPVLIPRALGVFTWHDENAQKTSWTPWVTGRGGEAPGRAHRVHRIGGPALRRGRRPGRSVRRGQALVRRRLDAHRAEATHLHRRRHQCVLVALR